MSPRQSAGPHTLCWRVIASRTYEAGMTVLLWSRVDEDGTIHVPWPIRVGGGEPVSAGWIG